MNINLAGRTAIVTGGSKGIGFAIATRFAASGAEVAIVARGREALDAAVKSIGAGGRRVVGLTGDVARADDIKRVYEEAMRALGKLDIVVNNAGWTHRNKPFVEVGEAEFDKVYAVNVKSVYLSAQHVVPAFRKRGGGCFVNIASTAGVRPRPGLTVYNSSKGAVILMSRSMAAEFGPDKIRVNCVNPVFSPDTGLSAEFAGGSLSDEAKKRFLSTIPLGRFSTALDVANACLYLASDEAAFISGVCIEVDGARSV